MTFFLKKKSYLLNIQLLPIAGRNKRNCEFGLKNKRNKPTCKSLQWVSMENCLSPKISGSGTNILIPTGEAQVQTVLQ